MAGLCCPAVCTAQGVCCRASNHCCKITIGPRTEIGRSLSYVTIVSTRGRGPLAERPCPLCTFSRLGANAYL